MQKTYWWRILILIFSSFVVACGWIYETFYCFVYNKNYCPLDKFRLMILEPIVILSVFLLLISPFLFFIKDAVFLRWIKFAIAWFLLAVVFIALAPVYSGGSIGLNPNKESVSIWMGSLFVIFSLVQIVWYSKKVK